MNHLFTELEDQFEETVSLRRFLHQHPELSFEEIKTALLISEKLKNLGLTVIEHVGGNGVIGILEGAHDGATIAFRADFDALPIQDEKDTAYKSTVTGVMHACGHDGHTSALLSVAKILSSKRDIIHGTIVFIFQHAEEKPPGGAKFMIEAGALQRVDYVFGGHLATDLPIGKIATRPGPTMASVDRFVIEIQGKGGHGARPHETIDTIAIGCEIVSHLQQIVSRRINPVEPAVVTVGKFHAGNAFNVIANNALIEGTVRTMNPSVRTQIEKEIVAILNGSKVADAIEYTLEYEKGYPVLVNHEKEALVIESLIKENMGEESFTKKELALGAEDFAYYLEQKPGAFFFVGARNENSHTQFPHHHPKFDFDEKALLHLGKVFLLLADHYVINK